MSHLKSINLQETTSSITDIPNSVWCVFVHNYVCRQFI